MVKQAAIHWVNSEGARGGASVFAFQDVATPGLVRATLMAMQNLWAAAAASSWTSITGSELQRRDTATGQLLGVEGMSQATAVGAVPEEALPDANCGLLQFSTGGIVNGHRVRGRTFVPGLPLTSIQDGQFTPVTVSALTSMANALQGDSRFQIWSRPTPSRAGSLWPTTGAGAWNQVAVLRARRQR